MSPARRDDPPPRAEPGGALFWLATAVGLALVGVGAAGLLRDLPGPALRSWATLFAGGLIAHDLIAAPLVALVSLLLVRLLPAWARPPLQAGLIVTALVAVVAFPLVVPDGRIPGNPSLLPDDYGRNLALLLAAVWLVTLAGLARAARRRAR